LNQVPSEFTLYGGTAIALHLGHRQSVDFDFFARTAINPANLYAEIPFLKDAKVIQQEKNTLTCRVDRGEPVLVSFFGLPNIGSVQSPEVCDENQLHVASLTDLAGMKAAVVQQRAEAKEYIDLDAIIAAGISLPTALSAAGTIYGAGFNPQITLKALSYFGDGDLVQLPNEIKQRLINAITGTDLSKLP
jgi:Nucleotidyl transferase AbiEii toxin, Type IV TA system